jgi:hypothetical protein
MLASPTLAFVSILQTNGAKRSRAKFCPLQVILYLCVHFVIKSAGIIARYFGTIIIILKINYVRHYCIR